MGEDEPEQLGKFKDIIEVSREVKKEEIAKYLGILIHKTLKTKIKTFIPYTAQLQFD